MSRGQKGTIYKGLPSYSFLGSQVSLNLLCLSSQAYRMKKIYGVMLQWFRPNSANMRVCRQTISDKFPKSYADAER